MKIIQDSKWQMADRKLQSPKIKVQKSKSKNQRSKTKVQRPKSEDQRPKQQRTTAGGQRTKTKSAIHNPQSAIVLVGFMASGKTTVAKTLAEKLGCDFVDLDSFIELREGRMIASIIDSEGEARFREIETKALFDVLENKSAKIIALGGGAWAIEENRRLISEKNCLTIWLDVPFEVCWERIVSEGNTRPLARDKEKARTLYEQRRPIYALTEKRIEIREDTNAETLVEEFLFEMKEGK
jgi:shikimate kinase